MSPEWMKTDCGGDADCCYDVSHPIEAHKNFDLAVECDGSPECTCDECSLGTLYVTQHPRWLLGRRAERDGGKA